MKNLINIFIFITSFGYGQTIDFIGSNTIEWNVKKNPTAKKITLKKSNGLSDTDKFIKLLDSLSLVGGGTINIIGQPSINPKKTIEVPPNINLVCDGHSAINTDFNGVLFRLTNHFETTHVLKGLYKPTDKENQAFWIYKGETEPRNTKSVFVEVVNSRRVQLEISANGFNKGLSLHAMKEGIVECLFIVNEIRNCGFGIYAETTNNGWINQNNFLGRAGRIKNDGFRNRDDNSRIESGAIRIKGDGNTFIGLNLEGGSNGYEYVVKDFYNSNVYINCRFEGIGADQLQFMSRTGGALIIGGYGYQPYMTARLGKWADPYQKITARDYVMHHNSASSALGQGNLFLGGNQQPHSTPIPSLIVQETNKKGAVIVGQLKKDFLKFAFYSDGTVQFATNKSAFLDLKDYYQRFGAYKLKDYKIGEYYGIGDWFVYENRDYRASKIFKAVDFSRDYQTGNLRRSPRTGDVITFKDGYIYAKGLKNIKDFK